MCLIDAQSTSGKRFNLGKWATLFRFPNYPPSERVDSFEDKMLVKVDTFISLLKMIESGEAFSMESPSHQMKVILARDEASVFMELLSYQFF